MGHRFVTLARLVSQTGAAWWRAHVGEDIELRGIFEDADGQGGGIVGEYGSVAP